VRLFSLVTVLALAAACDVVPDADDNPGAAVEHRPSPWIKGLSVRTLTETAVRADDWLGPPAPGCQSGQTSAKMITADVGPAPGREVIVASSAHGVVVLGANGQRIGAVPFDCGGSADAIVSLAVADLAGQAVIAVVATAGGHDQEETRVELIAVTEHGVDRLFTGAIEARDGDQVRTGRLDYATDGLVHRAPDGRVQRWRFDPWAHRFTLRGLNEPR